MERKDIKHYEKVPKISYGIKGDKFVSPKINGKEFDFYNDSESREIFIRSLCQATQQSEYDLAALSLERIRIALCQLDEEKPHAFILNTLQQLQPKDSVEFSLIQQFITLHAQGINRLARAAQSRDLDHSNKEVNMATKLLRLSQETLSTLMKYRNKGQQQVFVTHVNDGGKAIVGNINHGGGNDNK